MVLYKKSVVPTRNYNVNWLRSLMLKAKLEDFRFLVSFLVLTGLTMQSYAMHLHSGSHNSAHIFSLLRNHY